MDEAAVPRSWLKDGVERVKCHSIQVLGIPIACLRKELLGIISCFRKCKVKHHLEPTQ